jgi:hypothetical protein
VAEESVQIGAGTEEEVRRPRRRWKDDVEEILELGYFKQEIDVTE